MGVLKINNAVRDFQQWYFIATHHFWLDRKYKRRFGIKEFASFGPNVPLPQSIHDKLHWFFCLFRLMDNSSLVQRYTNLPLWSTLLLLVMILLLSWLHSCRHDNNSSEVCFFLYHDDAMGVKTDISYSFFLQYSFPYAVVFNGSQKEWIASVIDPFKVISFPPKN